MIRYCRSELYRNCRSSAFWGLYAFISGLLLVCFVSMRFARVGLFSRLMGTSVAQELLRRLMTFSSALYILMFMGLFLFFILIPSISAKEKPIHTQLLSAGTRRSTVYFGDFLIQAGMAALLILVVVLALAVFTLLYLVSIPELPLVETLQKLAVPFRNFFLRIPAYWLLLVACDALSQTCLQAVKNKGWANTLSFFFLAVLPSTLDSVSKVSSSFQDSWLAQWIVRLSPIVAAQKMLNFSEIFNSLGIPSAVVPVDSKVVLLAALGTMIYSLALGYFLYSREEL